MGIRPSRLASVPVSIETIMADPVITLCHRSSNRGTEQIKSAVKWELSDSVLMCVTTIFDIFLSFLPLGQYNPQLLAKLFQFSAQLINFYLIFFYYLWVFSSSSSNICHGVGPLVDPFQSHVSRSLFKGLPWFPVPVGQQYFITLGNLF
jgi:hypothetical protein